MKRFFAMLLSLSLLASFASCGNPEESASESISESVSESASESVSESVSQSIRPGEYETGRDNEVDMGDLFEGSLSE